jgi:hypothetical protein
MVTMTVPPGPANAAVISIVPGTVDSAHRVEDPDQAAPCCHSLPIQEEENQA